MADENVNVDEVINDDELTEYEKSEKKKKKTIILIGLVVFQLILALIVVKFFIYPWYINNSSNADSTAETEEMNEKRSLGMIYKISDLTVNPKGSGGRRFAVFELALSVPNQITVETIKKYEPVIKDRYIQYFRSKSVSDLSVDSVIVQAKIDLKNIANDIIGKKDIQDIYFTRFVLQ